MSQNSRIITVCAAALMALVSPAVMAQDTLSIPTGSVAPAAEDVLKASVTNRDVVAPLAKAANSVPTSVPAVPVEMNVPAVPVAPVVQSPALSVANSASPFPAAEIPAEQVPAPVTVPVLAAAPFSAAAPQVGAYNPRNLVDRIINLRDAVAVGVLTNPDTEAVANNRRATDEELQQAKALYRPSIDMSADTGFESISSDPSGAASNGSDLWRSRASLTLTQLLFDGYGTKYENERQFHRVRSASHRVRESSEYKALDVIESYLDVLRQRELLQIAQENMTRHNDIMGQIIESANAGRITQADVEQTKARVNAAEAQDALVRQSLSSAENKFRRVVGDAPQPDIQVPIAPRELLESSVDQEIKQALTHNATIDIKEADVNVADAERKGAKSSFYPKVEFQAGGSVGRNLDGTEGSSESASALVVANWNLYRGGGDESRVREMTYRFAQTKDDRNSAARAIEQDVRQTWDSMTSAAERAAAFRKQADANGMVVEAYKDQFNLDRRTLLDVLDSQNEWFVSRSNAINNGYLEMFAVYRLLALRSALLPALGVSYPGEADPAYTSRVKGYRVANVKKG